MFYVKHLMNAHFVRGRTDTYIRDRSSDLYVGIDMVKNYCLTNGMGGARQRKGKSYHKLHKIEALL